MKKFLAIILAVIYLGAASGATIHVHYCMGRMYAIDLVKKDDCSKCGMKSAEGCCKDEFKVVKVKDNHQLTNNSINLACSCITSILIHNVSEVAFNAVGATLATHNNSPPRSSSVSLSILHCVFRL